MKAYAVTDFKVKAEGDSFLQSLQKGVEQRRKDYETNRFSVTYGPALVEVWALHPRGAAAFAERVGSMPRPTQVAFFLSEGAVVACKELGIKFLDLGGENKEIPVEAMRVLKADFRTTEPFGSANPA